MRNLTSLLLLALLFLPACCIADIDILGGCREGPEGRDENLSGEPINAHVFPMLHPGEADTLRWQIRNVGDEPGTPFARVTDCEWVRVLTDLSGVILLPDQVAFVEAEISFTVENCVANVACEIETGVE